jgi:hypothetical protein
MLKAAYDRAMKRGKAAGRLAKEVQTEFAEEHGTTWGAIRQRFRRFKCTGNGMGVLGEWLADVDTERGALSHPRKARAKAANAARLPKVAPGCPSSIVPNPTKPA